MITSFVLPDGKAEESSRITGFRITTPSGDEMRVEVREGPLGWEFHLGGVGQVEPLFEKR